MDWREALSDDYPFMDKFRVNGVFDREAWLAAYKAWGIRRRRAVEFAPAASQSAPGESSIMDDWGWH